MVRELDSKAYQKVKLTLKKSPLPEIENVRNWGITLCKGYNKPILLPDTEDIKWFWANMDHIQDEAIVEDLLLRAHPELKDYYQFSKLNWTDAFKAFWLDDDDALKKGLYGTGLFDYILFFTLLWPFPDIGKCTFWNFTDLAYKIKEPEFKAGAADWVLEHYPDIFEKIDRGDVLPYLATKWFPHQDLKSVLLKRLTKHKTIGPLLKQAAKLTDKGVDVIFEEAAVGPKT